MKVIAVVDDPSAVIVLDAADPEKSVAVPPLIVIVPVVPENPPDDAVTVAVPASIEAVSVAVAFPSAPVVALDGLMVGRLVAGVAPVARLNETDAPVMTLPLESFTVAVTVALSRIFMVVLSMEMVTEATGPVVNETVAVLLSAVPPEVIAVAVIVALDPAVVVEEDDRTIVAFPVLVLVVADEAESEPALVPKVMVCAVPLMVLPLASRSFAVIVEEPPTAGIESGLADRDSVVAEPQTVVIL